MSGAAPPHLGSVYFLRITCQHKKVITSGCLAREAKHFCPRVDLLRVSVMSPERHVDMRRTHTPATAFTSFPVSFSVRPLIPRPCPFVLTQSVSYPAFPQLFSFSKHTLESCFIMLHTLFDNHHHHHCSFPLQYHYENQHHITAFLFTTIIPPLFTSPHHHQHQDHHTSSPIIQHHHYCHFKHPVPLHTPYSNTNSNIKIIGFCFTPSHHHLHNHHNRHPTNNQVS